MARGRGTYILFSHHGSHHVGGLLLALQGYKKLAAVAIPKKAPWPLRAGLLRPHLPRISG